MLSKRTAIISKCRNRNSDWIISLTRFTVSALQNVLQFFILIEILENSTHIDKLVELQYFCANIT